MDYDPLRRGFAEFVGAFTLVFIGAGSTLSIIKLLAPALRQGGDIASVYSGFTLVGVALANGLAIGVMVSAMGHISGGHFNPAITLGFFLTRRLAPVLALAYWLAQFAAGATAALLLKWIFPETVRNLATLGSPAGVVVGLRGCGLAFFKLGAAFGNVLPWGKCRQLLGIVAGRFVLRHRFRPKHRPSWLFDD